MEIAPLHVYGTRKFVRVRFCEMFRVIEVNVNAQTVLRAIPIVFNNKTEAVYYARHLNGRYEAMKRPTRFAVQTQEEDARQIAVPPVFVLPLQQSYPEPMYKEK